MAPDDHERERLQRFRWDVGDRIRAIRRERGVAQDQLALHIGVDRTTMWRWESGQHPMNLHDLARIAWALDVPVWRLFRDDDHADGGSSGTD